MLRFQNRAGFLRHQSVVSIIRLLISRSSLVYKEINDKVYQYFCLPLALEFSFASKKNLLEGIRNF